MLTRRAKAYSSSGSRWVNIQIPNSLSGSYNDSSVAPPCEWYTLVSQPEIAKKFINLLFWRSRSFKVIKFGANQEPVYDFLLVINSNLGTISHRYWDTATYQQKIANYAHPLSFSALVRGDPFKFMEKLYSFWN